MFGTKSKNVNYIWNYIIHNTNLYFNYAFHNIKLKKKYELYFKFYNL